MYISQKKRMSLQCRKRKKRKIWIQANGGNTLQLKFNLESKYFIEKGIICYKELKRLSTTSWKCIKCCQTFSYNTCKTCVSTIQKKVFKISIITLGRQNMQKTTKEIIRNLKPEQIIIYLFHTFCYYCIWSQNQFMINDEWNLS